MVNDCQPNTMTASSIFIVGLPFLLLLLLLFVSPLLSLPCSSATDWQGCLLQLHRECGGEWKAIESSKLREREAVLSKKCEEVRHKAIVAVLGSSYN